MIEPSMALATISRCEREGYKLPAKAAKLLKATDAAIDPEELYMGTRAELRDAMLAGEPGAITDALVNVGAASGRSAMREAIEEAQRSLTLELIRMIGKPAFAFARKRYDAAGAALSAALSACDVMAGPDDVGGMTPEELKAWSSLGELHDDLQSASRLLADVFSQVLGRVWRSARPEYAAGLYLVGGDPEKVRQVFAWRPAPRDFPVNPSGPSALANIAGSRAGIWGAWFLYAGAELRCPIEDPADFAPMSSESRERQEVV